MRPESRRHDRKEAPRTAWELKLTRWLASGGPQGAVQPPHHWQTATGAPRCACCAGVLTAKEAETARAKALGSRRRPVPFCTHHEKAVITAVTEWMAGGARQASADGAV